MSGRGVPPAFRRLCAREQLALLRAYPRLLPRLTRWGLGPADARAVAYNTTLLWYVLETADRPAAAGGLLERHSLGEIAELCDIYRRVAAGELEYGEAET